MWIWQFKDRQIRRIRIKRRKKKRVILVLQQLLPQRFRLMPLWMISGSLRLISIYALQNRYLATSRDISYQEPPLITYYALDYSLSTRATLLVFLNHYNQIQFTIPYSKRVPFLKIWNTNALKWYLKMFLEKKMGLDKSSGGQNSLKKKLLRIMQSFLRKKFIPKLNKRLKKLKRSKK